MLSSSSSWKTRSGDFILDMELLTSFFLPNDNLQVEDFDDVIIVSADKQIWSLEKSVQDRVNARVAKIAPAEIPNDKQKFVMEEARFSPKEPVLNNATAQMDPAEHVKDCAGVDRVLRKPRLEPDPIFQPLLECLRIRFHEPLIVMLWPILMMRSISSRAFSN